VVVSGHDVSNVVGLSDSTQRCLRGEGRATAANALWHQSPAINHETLTSNESRL
jgi:hypothetical protein